MVKLFYPLLILATLLAAAALLAPREGGGPPFGEVTAGELPSPPGELPQWWRGATMANAAQPPGGAAGPAVRPEGWPGGAYPASEAVPQAPAPGWPGWPATAIRSPEVFPATELEGAKVIARVGSEVILAGEVVDGVDAALANWAAGSEQKIPSEVLQQQRQQLIRRALKQLIDVRLVMAEVRRKIPKENLDGIMQKLDDQFYASEVPRMLKATGAASTAELDTLLKAQGSSIERARRSFAERVLASQWVKQQVKADDEVTHAEMLDYYHDHVAAFTHPARVRWEHLAVDQKKYRSKDEAWRALAAAGNQVIDGRPLADVARQMSDGWTASDGGQHDWTSRGSLAAKVLDQAIFALPVGTLSPILDDESMFHIVRVLERQEESRTPFVEAQVEIKKKIQEARTSRQLGQYVEQLRGTTPVWTIFDQEAPPERDAAVREAYRDTARPPPR